MSVCPVELVVVELLCQKLSAVLSPLGVEALELHSAWRPPTPSGRRVGFLRAELIVEEVPVELEVDERALLRLAREFVPAARCPMLANSVLAEGAAGLLFARVQQAIDGVAQLTVRSLTLIPLHYRVALDDHPKAEPGGCGPSLELVISSGAIQEAVIVRTSADLTQLGSFSDLLMRAKHRLGSISLEAKLYATNATQLLLNVTNVSAQQLTRRTMEQGERNHAQTACAELQIQLELDHAQTELTATVVTQAKPTASMVQAELLLGTVELSLLDLLQLQPGSIVALDGLSLTSIELRCGRVGFAKATIEHEEQQTVLRITSIASMAE